MATSAAKNSTATLVLLAGWLFSACSAGVSQPPARQPYRPPTPAVTSQPPTPAANSIRTQAVSTTIPACQDNLTYIEDLTIPDGSVVSPGTQLDKRWKVENSGSCNWDERYELRLVAGSEMGAPTNQDIIPARSHTQTTFRIQLAAPAEAGVYRSAWQAYDPQEQPFGDLVFIEIVVSP